MSDEKQRMFIGDEYEVRTQGHGNFQGQYLGGDDTWADFLITKGAATYLTRESDVVGDQVRERVSLCTFKNISEESPNA